MMQRAGNEGAVAQVIAAFGSQSALARALGARQSTVQHWARTGQIPTWRHAEIRRAAGEQGIPLDRTGWSGAAWPPPGGLGQPGEPGQPGKSLTHGRLDTVGEASLAGHEMEALRAEVAQLREVVQRLLEEITRIGVGLGAGPGAPSTPATSGDGAASADAGR